ncbi:hypothetical protein Y590_05805 [Methylobacterium sp. AMS5]|nr:hypothetical protein Y590_05805 [Methylobacterium sp. AMS5]
MTRQYSWAGWLLGGLESRTDALLRIQQLLVLTIWLVPVNWILGTSLIWLYAVALASVGSMRRPSGPEYALLGLSAALLLGLAVSGNPSVDRTLGSIYNLTLIGALIIIMNAARHLARSRPAELQRLWAAAIALFLVQALWAFGIWVAVMSTGILDAQVKTLVVGAIGDLPGVLAEYSRALIVETDWTSTGPTLRVSGFGLYATEGALLVALAGLLAAIRLAATRRPVLLIALVEVVTVIALVLAASRTTLLGYVASAVLLAGLTGRRALVGVLITLPIAVLAVGATLHYGPAALSEAFTALNSSRAGSSDTRFLSYTLAIDMVMQENPLTGLGIKPRDPSLLEIPIGSHSSFISMFTKGGFVALSLFTAFYGIIIARMIGVQQRLLLSGPGDPIQGRRVALIYLSRAVFVILVWWTTEDFDAPAQAVLVTAICLGTFWGLSESTQPETRLPWGRGTARVRILPRTTDQTGRLQGHVPALHSPVSDAR